MAREHVAWLRYKIGNDGRPTTIHVCDSDAPGAFKVYRAPPGAVGREALLDIVNGSDLKAWALRDIAAKALDQMDRDSESLQQDSAQEKP